MEDSPRLQEAPTAAESQDLKGENYNRGANHWEVAPRLPREGAAERRDGALTARKLPGGAGRRDGAGTCMPTKCQSGVGI